jgi:hypothetical protein
MMQETVHYVGRVSTQQNKARWLPPQTFEVGLTEKVSAELDYC